MVQAYVEIFNVVVELLVAKFLTEVICFLEGSYAIPVKSNEILGTTVLTDF
jgi:hypothetical protein